MNIRARHPALCILHSALCIATAASAAAAEVRGEATGFFHVERIDGRDWAIDPQGRGVVLTGVDWVWPAGFFCEKLGFSPYGRFVETNYPSREVWADETAERLHAWGFNLLGSGCDDALLAPRGFVHTAMLNLGYRLAHDPDKTKAIAPGLDRPGTAFPNVFHPDFEAECDRAAAATAAKYRDDPLLLGYFLDNELSWGGISRNIDEGMFDAAMSWPPDHPAKQAVEEFVAHYLQTQRREGKQADLLTPNGVRETETVSRVSGEQIRLFNPDNSAALREPSPAMKREFLALVAERYFATMAGALRRHDPNHMVLGCRFAGMGASDVVLAAAGRHCDVVTFNCYPWTDLDRGVVLTRKDGPLLVDAFREFHEKCDAPVLVTEWSFSALDAGRPCSDGAGQRFRTQAERAAAAELCLRTMLSIPFQIGHCWFMWTDQPALGFNRHFHEDCNYGLVSEKGVPYAELTAMFKRVHTKAIALRGSHGPSGLSGPTVPSGPSGRSGSAALCSERERFFAAALRREATLRPRSGHISGEAALNAVGFHLEADGSWTLSNSLVRLSGRIGSSCMVDELARDGRAFGRCNARIMTTEPNWPPVTRLVSVKSEEAPAGCRSVVLVGEGGSLVTRPTSLATGDGKGIAFAIALRFTLAPGSPEVLAEILAVRNLGSEPLSIEKIFLCPLAGGDAPPEREPTAINVWKGCNESYWRLADGRRYGARSLDESADGFNLWTEPDGRQHADVPFRPAPDPVVLAPGETLRAPRPMGATHVME